MIHDEGDQPPVKWGEQLTVPRGIPSERSSPVSADSTSADRVLSLSVLMKQCQWEIQAYHRGEHSNEAYSLELLHRAIVQGDPAARPGVQQCLGEIVRAWLRYHPSREAACRCESEEHYIALAFERFWQATVQQQVVFKTLAGALVYLRASLNGAVLDTLRTYSWPRVVPLQEPGEPHVEDHTESNEAWNILQTMLPSVHEQRLAYLLYHCGLKPREIVRFYPQEWSDVREIYRLLGTILVRVSTAK